MKRTIPTVSILAAALLAGACDGGAADGVDAGGGLGLSLPTALLQSRAVDRTRLAPRVNVVDEAAGTERLIPMTRDGERWRGTIGVAPDRDYTLDILWIETVASGERVRDLPLASLRQVVPVGPEGAVITIDTSQYDLDLDFDEDGATNLAEREASTDPFGDGFSIDEPAAPGTGVPVAPVEPDPEEPARDDEAGDPVEPTGETPLPGEPSDGVDPATPGPGDEDPLEPDVPDPTLPEEPSPSEPVEPEPVTPVDADVVIPRIAPDDAPRIDGRGVVNGDASVWGGEWANATSFDASGSRLFIDRLMIDQGTDETNGQAFRAWSAMHDGEFLYVLVVVEDDGRRVRDEAAGSTEIWQDDSLEVYVDGDNSKNARYGDDDDAGRILPLLAPGTTRQGTSDGIVRNFLSIDTPLRIDFATGPGIGPDGLRRPRYEQDVYELRIDLDSAGIVPGRVFGFELQVNDDDDGGDREAKWGWAHPARIDVDVDNTFLNPSFMGTAILE